MKAAVASQVGSALGLKETSAHIWLLVESNTDESGFLGA